MGYEPLPAQNLSKPRGHLSLRPRDVIPVRVLLCAAVGVQLSVAAVFGRRGGRGFKVECVSESWGSTSHARMR